MELPLEESGAPKWNKLPPAAPGALGGGGIMDPLLKTLARRGAPPPGGGGRHHVLAGRAALDLFRATAAAAGAQGADHRSRGGQPWSAYGWHFEPDKFVRALREVIDLPVVNVKED